jgi:clan AA aspartic protease
MITGKVTANREAVIELEIVGSNQRKEKVEAVIDTGFNVYLTLPSDLISSLKLRMAGNRRATLGDGNVVVLDVYLAKVLWHGQEKDVLVLQADGGPLVGMSLLYGSLVTLEVVDDGNVTIDSLP